METNLTTSRQHFIQGMSRISHFWGFSRGMGAIYGAIYLSPHPLSLDDLVEQAAVTKGAVSTNARQLERLGMVHKHIKVGERKDYYTAETNFWKIVKSVLKEREKSEFDLAIKTVGESLQMAQDASNSPDAQLAAFYQQRLSAMQAFFNTLDNLVAMVLALDEFRLSAFQKFFGSSQQKEK